MRAGFVVGALALVAAAGYTVREVNTGRQEERRNEAEGRLFNTAPEDVTAISVTRPDETVTLERSADGWRLLAPTASKADPESTGELLRLVSGATISRTIEASPSAPERYGFGAQATRVAVRTRAGGRQEVEVGLEAPTEEGVYVRRPGSPAVLLADAGMRDLSQVDGRLLAERLLFPAAAGSNRVDLRGRKANTILSVKNGGWYVSEPFQFPADRARVSALLDAFGHLKRQPAPSSPSLAEAGLQPPRMDVVFYGTDGSETSFQFGEAEGEGKVWAAAGEETPFLVDASIRDVLRESPEDWSEKRPADVNRYKVTRLSLRWADRVFQARKDASGWQDSRGRSILDASVLSLIAALCDTPGELISRDLRSVRIHPSLSAEIEEEGGRRQMIEGFGPGPEGTWLLRPRGFHPLLRMPESFMKALKERLDVVLGAGPPAPAPPPQ